MKKGWQTKRLGEACIAAKSERAPEGSVPYVEIGDIDIDTKKITSKEKASVKGSVFAPAGSLLVSRVRPTRGAISILERDSAVSTAFTILKPCNALDLRFLFFALAYSADFSGYLGKKQAGLLYPSVKEDDVLGYEVSYPESLQQQRCIVSILDRAFEGIATAKANTEKNLQNARAIFESHLHSEYGKKAFLGDLVNIKTGKLDANAAVEGGEYPFFTCSREAFAIDEYAFDCEAILLAGNNAVGDFNVKHYKGRFNAYQRTYVITVNEENRVLYRFLYFQMLKSLRRFKAQSVGAGTKFLKLGMIKGLEIELPSIAEQRRIVLTMDSVREETQRLESIYQQKLDALEALKKSLLHQAFSGQLGPQAA